MSADRQGRLDVQELERHNEAIRRLARGLVAGDDAADEVVQRTLVVALEAAPKDPSRPLAWLYGVMKNVVRTIRRGESRRERREAVAAKPEAVPSVLEDAAEIDARLRLWAHVRALGEPYRTVITLRYAENLAPAEIAIRLGIPAATVKTQLRRGLERLRSHLDESHRGRREAWLLVIVPEASKVPKPAPTHLATATLATALAVAACVGLIVVLPQSESEDAGPGVVGGPANGTGELAAAPAASRVTKAAEGAGAMQAGGGSGPAPGTTRELAVRVDRSAVPDAVGLRFRLRGRTGPERETTVGDDGYARFPDVADGQYVVWAEPHPTCTTYLTWVTLPQDPARPPAVALIPVAALAGRVVREGTRDPVAGARVVVAGTDQSLTSPVWQATSAADGSFRIASLPAQRSMFLEGLQIAAVAGGFAVNRRPLPFRGASPATPYSIELVLKSGVEVHGTVVDARGAPAVGVTVHAVVDPPSLGPPTPRRVRPFHPSRKTELLVAVDETYLAFDEESHLDTPRYDEPPVCATLTDANGAFHLQGLEPGLRYAFCATRAHETSPWIDAVSTPPVLRLPEIRLDGCGVLRLVVRDGARAPVAELQSKYQVFESPAPGLLVFPRLRSGSQKIDVMAPGFARRRLDLEIPVDQTTEVEVRLEPDVPIRGIVVDQLGRPVPRTGLAYMPGFNEPGSTAIEQESVETGPDGTFTIRGLAAGRYLVYLRDVNGQLHEEVAVTPGDPIRLVEPTLDGGRVVVEFTLPADVPAPGSLYVGVHDGQRSAPTRRREFLRRFMADRWGGLQFMSDRPWSGGRIELAVLPTDTELVAVVEGCAPVYLPLRPGGGAPLSVKLERGFPVRGRVVDRRGQPIPSACVATATFPTDWQIVKTNVAGYFVLEHVPAGPTVLLAHGEGHLTAEATVTVGPDLRDLTLTLDPGTTITGTVHDQTRGSTAPDTRIRFFRADDPPTATPVEEVAIGSLGTFSLVLSPGAYHVVAAQGDRKAEMRLDVTATPPPPLELTLRPATK